MNLQFMIGVAGQNDTLDDQSKGPDHISDKVHKVLGWRKGHGHKKNPLMTARF